MRSARRAQATDHPQPAEWDGVEKVRVAGKKEMSDLLTRKEGPAFFWGARYDDDPPAMERRLYFSVPDPATRSGWSVFYAGIVLGPRQGDIHGWNGDWDRPTLVDSVLCKFGDEELFHGWIRDGHIVSV